MVTLLDALRAWTVLLGIHVANATRGVEMEILVLFWYLLAAVGVALAASERGRGFLTWTVAALFLSPLFAVLLLIAFPPTARARAGAFVGPSSNAVPGRKYRKLMPEEPATAGTTDMSAPLPRSDLPSFETAEPAASASSRADEAPDRSTLTDLIETQSLPTAPINASEPAAEHLSLDQHQGGTTVLQLALAWGFVGIPLAWGVLQTLSNALTLFK
jgi:hypothetical protein